MLYPLQYIYIYGLCVCVLAIRQRIILKSWTGITVRPLTSKENNHTTHSQASGDRSNFPQHTAGPRVYLYIYIYTEFVLYMSKLTRRHLTEINGTHILCVCVCVLRERERVCRFRYSPYIYRVVHDWTIVRFAGLCSLYTRL